jgi:hypothetical protein
MKDACEKNKEMLSSKYLGHSKESFRYRGLVILCDLLEFGFRKVVSTLSPEKKDHTSCRLFRTACSIRRYCPVRRQPLCPLSETTSLHGDRWRIRT